MSTCTLVSRIIIHESSHILSILIEPVRLINDPETAVAFHFSLFHNNTLLNISFSERAVYHQNGVAYDYYAQHDLRLLKASAQWESWPLSDETNEANDHSSALVEKLSPSVVSKLPFVDAIYLMTDPTLTQRHVHLRNALLRQGVSIDQIQWRFKWNKTTCNAPSNHEHVYQRFNLKEKPLGISQNPAS